MSNRPTLFDACIFDQHPDHPLVKEAEKVLAQAIRGKGQARHGGEDYLKQPILEIPRRLSQSWRAGNESGEEAFEVGLGFLLGQALKKLGEAPRILQSDEGGMKAAVAEIHGAIVYSLTASLYLREMMEKIGITQSRRNILTEDPFPSMDEVESGDPFEPTEEEVQKMNQDTPCDCDCDCQKEDPKATLENDEDRPSYP